MMYIVNVSYLIAALSSPNVLTKLANEFAIYLLCCCCTEEGTAEEPIALPTDLPPVVPGPDSFTYNNCE